jgi:cytochrome c oxidase subunit 2
MITWAQLRLQDAASPIMEEFVFFHDFALVVLTFIVRFVGYIIVRMLGNAYVNTGLLEGQIIECVWTLVPAIILIQIAIPSLLLLYMLDERIKCRLTIKVVGHQWYWRYEYSDFWNKGGSALGFDRYIEPRAELRLGHSRLLEVDNRRVAPWEVHTRVLVRSADVLHAWTIPALGVKADACPGRLNQVKFVRHHPGVLYGQCREICGANHSFMPIVIEFVRAPDFLLWVDSSLN